ncbi:DUF3467 domain-containing protein [Maribacter chungangensis]|uniref:DUF3467 domain-containing protein n=1 Tax=Maribacter chungangensis TaxID=1069117 RepID=A0ABW3B5N2_9FLAO
MSDQKKSNQKQINIELDEKMAEGVYSNLAIINHSVSEFVVDFISMMPGAPKAKVKSRIVLTPQHAKKFLKALNDNVQRFEKAHGAIKDYEQTPVPINFGPIGEA